MQHTFGLFVVLVLCIIGAISQILDTNFAIVFEDPQADPSSTLTPQRRTYFGYSLVLFSSSNSTWLQVGAPRANYSEQPTIIEPGVVYRCHLPNGPCLYVPIDPSGNEDAEDYRDRKDGGWLGGSQAVHQKGDMVAVCAPRWSNQMRPTDWGMTGACHTSQASLPLDSLWNKHVPLLENELYQSSENGKKTETKFDYLMGQAGLSAFFVEEKVESTGKHSLELVLGAPGVRNWRGTPILLNIQKELFNQKLFKRSITESEDKTDSNVVMLLENSSEVVNGDYFGYCVTAGRFFSTNKLLYAGSAPRGDNYHGKVVLFEFPKKTRQPMKVAFVLRGKEFGGYFGASLVATDLSGDGLDDLLVTAPYLATPKVYIYLGSNKSSLEIPQNAPQHLEGGPLLGGDSQFAAAISAADLDQDGYNDVLVGAPGAADGFGALVIFRGGPNGVLSEKPSQVIFAKDIAPKLLPFMGFGASLSPPVDVDDNHYPDVAIGAYMSGHAIVLRSKAHARLKAKLTGPERLQRDNSASFTIDMCLIYSQLIHIPKTNIEVEVILSLDEELNRTYIDGNSSDSPSYAKTINLTLGNESCHSLNIFIKKGVQNYFDPIQILLKAMIINRIGTEFDKNDPVIAPAEFHLPIPFATECGDDNICYSDLHIEAHILDIGSSGFVLGSSGNLKLQMMLHNEGEPAYLTQVRVRIPHPAVVARLPPTCQQDSPEQLICNIDIALHKDIIKPLELEINVRRVKEPQLNIKIEALTKSEEVTPNDNAIEVILRLTIHAKLDVIGKSIKESNSYWDSDENDSSKLIRFDHMYEVQKSGVSPVEDAILSVMIPHTYSSGTEKFIFTKIHKPEGFISGHPFSCETTETIDIVYTNNEANSITKQIVQQDKTSNNDTWTISESLVRTKRTDILEETADKIMHVEKTTITDENITDNPSSGNNHTNELPANRTVRLNCESEGVTCHEMRCFLGPLQQEQAVASLLVKMELNMSLLKKPVMGHKDILVLETQSRLHVKSFYTLNNVINRGTAKVQSVFVSEPPEIQVQLWIIITSVVVGILLLLLIGTVLIKMGFFQRTMKEELNALKEAAATRNSMEDINLRKDNLNTE